MVFVCICVRACLRVRVRVCTGEVEKRNLKNWK